MTTPTNANLLLAHRQEHHGRGRRQQSRPPRHEDEEGHREHQQPNRRRRIRVLPAFSLVLILRAAFVSAVEGIAPAAAFSSFSTTSFGWRTTRRTTSWTTATQRDRSTGIGTTGSGLRSSERQQGEEGSGNSEDSDLAARRALERTKAHLEKLVRQHGRGRGRGIIAGGDGSAPVGEGRRGGGGAEASSAAGISPDSESSSKSDSDFDPFGVERDRLRREYAMKSANSLKMELKRRKLPQHGRKPDLALRLAENDLIARYGDGDNGIGGGLGDGLLEDIDGASGKEIGGKEGGDEDGDDGKVAARSGLTTGFAGLPLSATASRALARADFGTATPIQASAIPKLARGESAVLHAETGSGKTLAYLLPITERLWSSTIEARRGGYEDREEDSSVAVVLTPTRELASQVAGIASVLAPPGSVRLLSQPTNVVARNVVAKERVGRDSSTGVPTDDQGGSRGIKPRLYVSSAKTMAQSLYGDGGTRMPAPPTPKPLAREFLRNVRYLVLDEVDRLLMGSGGGGGGGTKKRNSSRSQRQHQHRHEKPAAIVTAAIMRQSLGRCQVAAASATVGRPLRRELSRVLGVTPQECPAIIRGDASNEEGSDADQGRELHMATSGGATSQQRAVTIPDTVQNFVYAVDQQGGIRKSVEVSGDDAVTDGQLLTGAYRVIQALVENNSASVPKILLVLTRGFGIHTSNAIGALRHFGCRPEPVSLLDALQSDGGAGAGGTDSLMERHRKVSGASGVGEASAGSSSSSATAPYFDADKSNAKRGDDGGYLLVTGEDTIRGLHFDDLDVVLVVGRPHGVDEYVHVAGRTGRAGRRGSVVNVVSEADARKLESWRSMLNCDFVRASSLDELRSRIVAVAA